MYSFVQKECYTMLDMIKYLVQLFNFTNVIINMFVTDCTPCQNWMFRTWCIEFGLTFGENFCQTLCEFFVVDISEDVVNAAILKQILLNSWKLQKKQRGWSNSQHIQKQFTYKN